MKDILTPTIEIENKIKEIMTSFNIDNYKIIHLRFGDIFLHHDFYDEKLYNQYYDKINKLVNENQMKTMYLYLIHLL